MRRKLAKLTAVEERAWEHAWRYHAIDGKQGQDRAANRAWRDLQREFPRLREYDGARP